MTKGWRLFGLILDGVLVFFFILSFIVSNGWEAGLSIALAAIFAWDWYKGYTAKIIEED